MSNAGLRRKQIAAYIHDLPNESLKRIIEAEHWTKGSFNPEKAPSMCLVNHAAGTYAEGEKHPDGTSIRWLVDHKNPFVHNNGVGTAFDSLVNKIGLEAAVGFCKKKARETLKQRLKEPEETEVFPDGLPTFEEEEESEKRELIHA